MKNVVLFSFLTFVLISCSQKSENSNQEFLIPSSVWDKNFEIKFPFHHSDTSKLSTVKADFYTSKSYNFSKLIFYCKIISPSGSVREKNYTIDIKDNNGDRLGANGDNSFKHSIELISKNRLQEQGDYQLIVRQDMPMESLIGIEKIVLSYMVVDR